ncbi:hypothetical protein [Leptospira santarosai]|uniref:hypothetical protein n=1 Tax=Leptospira santarosai TaxID=28183 RepID=UPI00036FA124|nr:hypothetical protein [Leptospira santarosai]
MRYFIYFREKNESARKFRIESQSLLGAKQKASRLFKFEMSESTVTAIEIAAAYSKKPFWVAHKFIGSKKWSSFA